jgi:hypothetical protein
MADTADRDLDQNLAVFGLRDWHVEKLEGFIFNRSDFL